MKIQTIKRLGMLAVVAAGTMAVVGCGQKTDTGTTTTAGRAEAAGIAADNAAEKTVDAANAAAAKVSETAKDTADATRKSADAAAEKAGAALEEAGENMQK